MCEDLENLIDEFPVFQKAFKDRNASEIANSLTKILEYLRKLKYSRRDLTSALDVESQTIEKWLEGKSMKPETYKDFCKFLEQVIAGKAQRSLIVSQSGFMTWRYLFEFQQPKSNRVWYITSSSFLALRSAEFKEVLIKLFLASLQDEENRPAPVLVYLYPRNGQTQGSLYELDQHLEDTQKNNLRGTIVGIGVDTSKIPWFLPGLRVVIFEKRGDNQSIDLEGAIRIPLLDEVKEALLTALDPMEESPRTPWLSVAHNTVKLWHSDCKDYCLKIVENALDEQKKNNIPFKVHFKNM